MRVRFLRDRDWDVPGDGRTTVAYKAGMEETVKRGWGEQMAADGDAEEIEAPPRSTDEQAATPGEVKPKGRTDAKA